MRTVIMKKTWNRYIVLPLLAGVLGLAACSSDEPTETMETATVEFRLTKSPGQPLPVQKDQLMRLFVSERKPEHGVEELHLAGVLEDVQEGHLTFRRLKPQWYKFVFVCVPRNGNNQPLNLFTEENPGDATCDMNRILLDYAPILSLGPGSEDYQNARPLPPGDIYREVASLWLEKGVVAKEDVILKRINGQIVIDMGILVDQFEHRVDSVCLELHNLPTRLYLTDNDKDEIKTATPHTVRFTTCPYDQVRVAENQRKPHKLVANLLPCELDGKLIVYTTETNGIQHLFEFPLRDESENIFRIKPNTRTVLRFNGISKEFFDVKYAGYEDTQIGVGDDNWNGWTPLNK